ncbi:hypothetical protein [Halorussus salinus]|uniref:hypothetical protein n=1 Tax=Halorussus salinus TaxID=1364935 RepID=UPI001091FFD5|nr:hypothetical protein [Halorussus salinus]
MSEETGATTGEVKTEAEVETEPGDTMWERGRVNEAKLWLLIEANRGVVTVVGLVGLFGGLLALSTFGPSSVEKLLGSDELSTLFASIVGAIITSVTLILTITQLVISQEVGSLGDQSERLHEQKEFRERVEETADLDVSPTEPATFFRALLRATEQEARVLREEVARREAEADEPANRGDGSGEGVAAASAAADGASVADDPSGADDSSVTDDSSVADDLRPLAAFADSIAEECRLVEEDLKDEEFGTFTVVTAVLNFNYSRKINDARRLRREYGDRLSESGEAALSDLMDLLELFGPTRGFFKSLYFQWELINVSRGMVYAALPGLVVAAYLILTFDAPQVDGTLFGVENLYLLVSAAYALTLAPFVLLLVYVLRILTVLKRTLAPGSFVLRGTDRDESLRWE